LIDRIKQLSKQPAVPLLTFALDRFSSSDEALCITRDELYVVLVKIEKLVGTMVLDGKLTLLRSRLIRQLHQWNTYRNREQQRAASLFAQAVDSECISAEKMTAILAHDYLQGTDAHPEGLYQNVGGAVVLALFDAIEEELSGASAAVISSGNSFWVEHVLPQDTTLWQTDFASWECDVREATRRMHNIGNLVPLTSLTNSQISNKPLSQKVSLIADAREPDVEVRTMPEGLHRRTTRWTAAEIDRRATKLTDVLRTRWYSP
jgi:hypothetical protein